jgi:hypothetical protein
MIISSSGSNHTQTALVVKAAWLGVLSKYVARRMFWGMHVASPLQVSAVCPFTADSTDRVQLSSLRAPRALFVYHTGIPMHTRWMRYVTATAEHCTSRHIVSFCKVPFISDRVRGIKRHLPQRPLTAVQIHSVMLCK